MNRSHSIWLLLALVVLLPANRVSAADFKPVILDKSYIAYERDVGDIDGDGRNDVIAVMEGDTTVQVFSAPEWKRATLMTFAGEHRYPRADDIKLADVDHDGDVDVVTRLGKGASDDGLGIAVWCENSGQGTSFFQHLIGHSLEYVKDIVVSDFDRNGRLDVAMRMDSKTQIWLRNPDRTWSEVLLSHPPHEGMEAGDLDMDGDPDLVLNGYWFETPNSPAAARVPTNYLFHIIDAAWYRQTGDWTANSCKVVVGDFDGDRRNDVAFSHSERAGHAVTWYGSPTPRADDSWTRNPVKIVDFCHTLQAEDFDLDGRPDLLVGGMIQSQHRGLRLLHNLGGGTNWSELVIQTNGSYSAELGDIDNDGNPDIVGIRNWNSAPSWIYRNNASKRARQRWTYHQVSAKHVRTFGLCFPDVDGDGDLDIASGPFAYLNPGSPMTNAWPQVALPGGIHAFVTLDVDGDRSADLIGQKDNPAEKRIDLFWVEATNAAGTAWEAPRFIGHVPRSDHPEGFQGYRVAQIVAGGNPEIVLSTMQGIYYLSVPLTSSANGHWPLTLVAPNDSDEGIGVADIDGDNHLDISFTSGNSKEVKWARNPGHGTPNWRVFAVGSFPEADWPDRCEAADLNGDGRVDIVVTEENAGKAADALACWWEHPAPPNAKWRRHTISTQFTMNSMDVADMDHDGDPDLILAEHRGPRRIAVWENSGRGSFAERLVGEGHESHLGGRISDLDGDGDLDLASIAYDDSTKVHLWRNDRSRLTAKVVRSADDSWGIVQATIGDGFEADGTILLENQVIRVRYEAKRFADGNKDHVITDFLVKETGGQLAVGDQIDGIWMNADEGRGCITAAAVRCDQRDRKTIRVEWDHGKVIQEFTLCPDRPVVQIDYIDYGINIVDMVSSVDTFEIYGASAWRDARSRATNEAALNHTNPHHRLTTELYPRYPFPLLATHDWKTLEPKELTYQGYLILGAYEQQTGLGFGRVFPAQDANYLKLLNMGFEVFANWHQPHRRFTSYLYVVTGGRDELIASGKAIVEAAVR
ncbi:MAG: FG-GAP repeat domain-containing protein [Verrucomicrobiia bacterium]